MAAKRKRKKKHGLIWTIDKLVKQNDGITKRKIWRELLIIFPNWEKRTPGMRRTLKRHLDLLTHGDKKHPKIKATLNSKTNKYSWIAKKKKRSLSNNKPFAEDSFGGFYTVSKRIEIAGGHRLNLPYKSDCNNQHGHNWIVTVEITNDILNAEGMVIDFKILKQILKESVEEKLDHNNLTPELMGFNPTAENIAKYIFDVVQSHLIGDGPEGPEDAFPFVSKVTVQESEGNVACYIP